MKPVKGWEEYYSITEDGEVWSNRTQTWLTPALRWGRWAYCFKVRGENISKTVFIHRLVAQTYIENHRQLRNVTFKDGDFNNYHVNNLRWATLSEVARKRKRSDHGKDTVKVAQQSCRKFTDEQVRSFRALYGKFTNKQLADANNVSESTIAKITGRRSYKHVKDIT